jgi:hypothetical protein
MSGKADHTKVQRREELSAFQTCEPPNPFSYGGGGKKVVFILSPTCTA